jgi:hypothetical protein
MVYVSEKAEGFAKQADYRKQQLFRRRAETKTNFSVSSVPLKPQHREHGESQ